VIIPIDSKFFLHNSLCVILCVIGSSVTINENIRVFVNSRYIGVCKHAFVDDVVV